MFSSYLKEILLPLTGHRLNYSNLIEENNLYIDLVIYYSQLIGIHIRILVFLYWHFFRHSWLFFDNRSFSSKFVVFLQNSSFSSEFAVFFQKWKFSENQKFPRKRQFFKNQKFPQNLDFLKIENFLRMWISSKLEIS